MATNGESARRWLQENQDRVSPERIRQIRDNIVSKLQSLDDTSDASDGLLEALDVMDAHLLQLDQQTDAQDVADASLLDNSPLVSEPTASTPLLNQEEKQKRFQQLLKTGKL